MKILDLPLKAKWYIMIESGEKLEEYREFKPHWIRRLMIPAQENPVFLSNIGEYPSNRRVYVGWVIRQDYTHVRFRYGYTRRTMLFELRMIVVGIGNPAWGAPNYEVFILKLGRRVS